LADDIEDTALSLVSVINQYASNTTVYAFYDSGYNDLPGQIRLVARLLGTTAFNTISSVGTAWSPNLTAVASTNDTNPNYLYISKNQQPEAVPIPTICPSAARILPFNGFCRSATWFWCGKPAKESLPSMETTFPTSKFSRLIARCGFLRPIRAVTFNNAGYAFTDQGVVATSNAQGSPIMSRAIEKELVELSSDLYPFFPTATWAVGYESDRKYILGTVSATNDERRPNLSFITR
jgi:hypothetical protein